MRPDDPTPFADVPSDDPLRAHLRAASPSPRLDAGRADALAQRIHAAAAARLAARATPPSWLDIAARWSRVAIPSSALAAGVGAILLARSATTPASTVASAPATAAAVTDARGALWTAGDSAMDAESVVLRANGVQVSDAGLSLQEAR